jgi:hypothetical protein
MKVSITLSNLGVQATRAADATSISGATISICNKRRLVQISRSINVLQKTYKRHAAYEKEIS